MSSNFDLPLDFTMSPLPAVLLGAALLALVWYAIANAKLKTALKANLAQEEEKNSQRLALQQAKLASDNQLQESVNEQIRLKSELSARELKIAELLNEQQGLRSDIENLQLERNSLNARTAELSARLNAQQTLSEQIQKTEQSARQELEARLIQLGQRLLNERGEALNRQSKEQLQQTVGPLTEELKHFREQLTLSQKISSEQSGALRSELLKLQQAQQSLTKQADDLTRALTSGAKAQGLWGEHQLELCLDSAGLRLNEEYAREVVSPEQGENGRPDVIVFLPQKHCLIIDAKCSLTDYTRFICADDKQERARALKDHLTSLRRHVDELGAKRYDTYAGFNSPSFVFMFVPIDNALTEGFLADPELYTYASLKNVYLVSPSTLMPALKVTANLWIIATQNDKVRRIALQAQKIYKKLEGINEAFADVKRRQEQLHGSISALDTKLCSGRGNLNTMLQSFAYKAPQSLGIMKANTEDQDPEEPELDPPAAEIQQYNLESLPLKKQLVISDKEQAALTGPQPPVEAQDSADKQVATETGKTAPERNDQDSGKIA